MRVESFAIHLRPRTDMEAADLGVRLCQSVARDVYRCYAAVFVPVAALTLATYGIASWLPGILLWWAKPWLDRTILFALSRAAFGQGTTPRDVWRAQRHVWWAQFLRTWTLRRLSPWRSFTQPVYQLEGLSGSALRKRVLQIRSGRTGSALLMTSAFSTTELALSVGLISLAVWFAPHGYEPDLMQTFLRAEESAIDFAMAVVFAAVVLFLEPLYVAAGFGMYLNRRVDLEAWDIEQEFRRAFAQ
ncbi:MAG: hypothetical protein ACT4O5_12485 [Gammaproteobacteria bacterium]